MWTEIIRVTVPGLILGIIVGKILADRIHYVRLIHPKFWISKAKKASKQQWIQTIALSIMFGLLSYFVGLEVKNIATDILGRHPFLSEENIFTEIAVFSLPLLIISITILPVLEEWIFRGIILEEISRITQSKWKGLLVSSLLFSFFHLSNPGTYLMALIPYFIGGTIIGVGYLAGGLSVAVFSHVIYNLLPFILIYI